MLCIRKHLTGGLRTVVDLRQRNENTVKDVTPFPDQDQIKHDVARAPFRSKIDMTDAYEQVRIEEKDIHKTGFATIYGTFHSRVLQQGDCNGPSTFQRLMTVIFQTELGIFVHVYLDDIFVFSYTIEDHERHLGIVYQRLFDAKLFLSKKKFDAFSVRMDCLGSIIDNEGLHADSDKMTLVRNWRTPRDYLDVQRFLGLINYLAQWMPNVAAYTTPLSGMCANNRPFIWRQIHQSCFDTIKALACKAPILKPVDFSQPEPVWIVADASVAGCGAYYGQGNEWHTIRPAGFMSRKWTNAQRNYYPFELEALAVLEALLKWEDRLIGHKIKIATDHRALTYFKVLIHQVPRHQRWSDYFQRFDYDITYIKGKSNFIGDITSRYFKSDLPNEKHPLETYANADARLDPDGDTLSQMRMVELALEKTPSSVELAQAQNLSLYYTNDALGEDQTSEQYSNVDASLDPLGVSLSSMRFKEVVQAQIMARRVVDAIEPREAEAMELREAARRSEAPRADPSAETAITEGPDLPESLTLDGPGLLDAIRAGYELDTTFKKILTEPKAFKLFDVTDGLIYYTPGVETRLLGIPKANYGPRRITELLLDQAHKVLGHFGRLRTSNYIRRWYWWPTLQSDTERFCKSCPQCQMNKVNTQLPPGLLNSMPIPSQPWESIGMDFVGPFPPSRNFDYLWVVICRLTSMVHLIPITTTIKASELASRFLREVVRLHGLPKSIVSDRDPKFTSAFWRETHRMLGVKLLMSTAFHPQTDGASERSIRNVNQILRNFVSPDQTNWADKITMVEFAINSSTSESSGYSPFELNYGYMPTMIENAGTTALKGVREFAETARNNLLEAHDAIIASRVHQTFYSNQGRRLAPEFPLNGLVYLSTKNLSLPKGRAWKISPRFVGPYKIINRNLETGNYTLDLPDELRKRRIHPTFHISLLQAHTPNDESRFPNRPLTQHYDFGEPDTSDEIAITSISGHFWRGKRLFLTVNWADGDTTTESVEFCEELAALSAYLEENSLGENDWNLLPRARRSRLAPRIPREADENPSDPTPVQTIRTTPRIGTRSSARLRALNNDIQAEQ